MMGAARDFRTAHGSPAVLAPVGSFVRTTGNDRASAQRSEAVEPAAAQMGATEPRRLASDRLKRASAEWRRPRIERSPR